MRVQPEGFTASGVVSSSVSGQQEMPVGLSFRGFTSVSVYNGTDNTGELVIFAPAPGTYSLSYELYCEHGCYVEVAGTGKGTLWLA